MESTGRPEERPLTVLVVDDEAGIREAVVYHLKDCGFLVLEACDGREALEILEAIPDIDILFSDVRMPGLGGVELAKWVSRNRPSTSIFLATGDMGKQFTADELCGAMVVRKPYRLHAISASLRDAAMTKRGMR
jgi:CheY-like chemotaxis protein